MKKFPPMKVKNGSIRLPEDFLDQLLINDGDHLLIVEEDGRFYIRKTRETSFDDDQTETQKEEAPKTFDEIMREAQRQFGGGENIPEDLMKNLQNTLQDPEMMKKIQDMAMGIFKGFSVPPSQPTDKTESTDKDTSVKKKKSKSKDEEDDGDDDDDSDDGFKINIE